MILSTTFASSIAIASLFSVASARRREGIPPHSSRWDKSNIKDLAKYCETAEDTHIILRGVTIGDKVNVDFGELCSGIAEDGLQCPYIADALAACRNNEVRTLVEIDYTGPGSEQVGIEVGKKVADHFLVTDTPKLVFPVYGFVTAKGMSDEKIKSLVLGVRGLQKGNTKIRPMVAVHREGRHTQANLMYEPLLNIRTVFLDLYGTPPNRVPTVILASAVVIWNAFLSKGFKIEMNMADAQPTDVDLIQLGMKNLPKEFPKYEVGSLEYLEKVEKIVLAVQAEKLLKSNGTTTDDIESADGEPLSNKEKTPIAPYAAAELSTKTMENELPSMANDLSKTTSLVEVLNTKPAGSNNTSVVQVGAALVSEIQNTDIADINTTVTATETRSATSTIEKCDDNGACQVHTATSTYVVRIEVCVSVPTDCVVCQPQEVKNFKCLEGECPSEEIAPMTRILLEDGEHPTHAAVASIKDTQSKNTIETSGKHDAGVTNAALPHDGKSVQSANKLGDDYKASDGSCTVGEKNTCIVTEPVAATDSPKSAPAGSQSSPAMPGAGQKFDVSEGTASKVTMSILIVGTFFFVAFA